MYKILLLQRGGANPLWATYKVLKPIDEENPEVEELIDYETNDISELENKIAELLSTIPKSNIKPIQDLEFMIDIIVQ